ncbi:unnamed protein product, partial [Didymodactylos carnosus]
SSQIPLTIDNFLLVVRTTDSQGELKTLTERLEQEIGKLRSKDIGGENGILLVFNHADVRAKLNSYNYLKRLLSDRLELQQRLEPSPFDDDDLSQRVPYHDLPLTEILNNCNGLDYFLKFLQSVDAVGYGSFYLNAEAFRCAGISVQQNNHDTSMEQHQANLEMLRNMANDLIEQYFLPTGTFKLALDENLIKKTLRILKSEAIDETLLDDLQNKAFEILSSDKYYGQFKTTPQYLKVLSEFDFADSMTMDNSDSASLSSNNSNDLIGDYDSNNAGSGSNSSGGTSVAAVIPDILDNIQNYTIQTAINDSGVCSEKGEKYAIYVISVSCKPIHPVESGNIDMLKGKEWITYRRFSEFNDLNMIIRKRYRDLQHIQLPTKSLINSTSQDVRLKRQKELNTYLTALINPKVMNNHPHLADLLLKFLRNQQWKCQHTDLTRKDVVKSTVDTIVTPFKQSALGIKNAVTSLPGNVVKSVNKVADGIQIVSDSVTDNMGKLFRTGQGLNDTSRDLQTFPIVEDYQNAKNIPLRVLLIIMDEVFDLKQKNMWFRSRFVSILKRVLRTFMGDSVNRDDYWPNGIMADKPSERDASVRHITQVLCKAKLLGIVSDELRHIIGSETTRRGLLRLFELLQNETLNRRFIFVLLEALLIKLFRPNDLHLIFEKLYSQSSRVKEEYKRRNNEVTVNSVDEQRAYFLNRLTVRSDDQLNVNMMLKRTNSINNNNNNSNLTTRNMPRSFSKISR